MNKEQKNNSLKELTDSFTNAKAAFFADYKGLTVEQTNEFRKNLRLQKVKVKIVKNNIARLAVKNAKLGDNANKMLDTVVGPTMIAFVDGDPAAAAKIVQKFADDNEVFGLKDSLLGTQVLNAAEVKVLSKLPSKEVLLAKMLGTLNAPITNFVGVLAAVPRSLVQVLSAIEAKKKQQS